MTQSFKIFNESGTLVVDAPAGDSLAAFFPACINPLATAFAIRALDLVPNVLVGDPLEAPEVDG